MMELVPPASTSQSMFRVAAAATVAAGVIVFMSPDLCAVSKPAETVHLAVSQGEGITRIDAIPDEYGDRYELLQEIPIDFEDVAPGAVIAHFREAELAVTGDDQWDARDGLVSWMLDVFDDLVDADPRVLGATPAMQIRVLSKYLRHR